MNLPNELAILHLEILAKRSEDIHLHRSFTETSFAELFRVPEYPTGE